MAGIYIHIPLCATRCIYCDFYSTTLKGREQQLITALTREMDERRNYLCEPIRTLYIGGGTPSQLGPAYMQQLLQAVAERFDLSECKEVTMEANPEDIGREEWQWGLINRVSMGVQSMVDDELRLLHRRHSSQRVREAVMNLREAGIGNISLDLMYGLPTQSLESWAYSIDEVLALEPEHLSAYNLMVEEGTALYDRVERGELMPCDDETCIKMARLLRERLKAAGYEQYEISNYARPGYHSRHNSAYWTQTPYLGLGPGAHSYDGNRCRSWNEPDLPFYLDNRRQEGSEQLTDVDLHNEMIMLGLRTMRGVDLMQLRHRRQLLAEAPNLEAIIENLTKRELVRVHHDAGTTAHSTHFALTEQGLALADEVIRELMI